MSARSRKPDTESLGIESNSVLASSRLQTGVLPFLTTYFGPRTECAGFDRVICRTTRKSYNIRTAASFCLMVGLDRAHLRFVKNFAGLLYFFMEERAAC